MLANLIAAAFALSAIATVAAFYAAIVASKALAAVKAECAAANADEDAHPWLGLSDFLPRK